MNEVPEQDLELLEEFLDEELDERQARQFEARLANEPALALALAELRAQREMLCEYVGSLEDEQAAQRVTQRVLSSVARRRHFVLSTGAMRWVSGIAACLVVGLIVWYAKPSARTPRGPHGPTASAEMYQVAVTDDLGRVVAVQQFRSREEAQRFSAMLADYQERLERSRSGELVLMRDDF